MAVAKVIEISAESDRSFEDAINQGITTAAKTVRNIKGAWVKEQHITIDNGRITSYRVNLLVTFILD